ncbi:hypothetical protein HAP47_0006235 [Bradyrhizobium sp. 41S5]|uniref:hypothetical protein n=1 Tax=Bradyrhizobium sp. 41S5 TaxID=1404443 RepID=UPI00156B16DD|nr:hypothetical protein [Bradyrhizobium sp. 41S5]UFX46290.1 hypothetical protein HAP47_0006235 [Bradyrhizobium sp. 41S5]
MTLVSVAFFDHPDLNQVRPRQKRCKLKFGDEGHHQAATCDELKDLKKEPSSAKKEAIEFLRNGSRARMISTRSPLLF